MSNPLDRVWSALSDASNALGDAMGDTLENRHSEVGRNLLEIDKAIDAVTQLVIARIERDKQAFEESV